jgi:Tol biopolymer transport system component
MKGISVNETYLWLLDAASGDKMELTPREGDEKIAYTSPRFSKDGQGIYYTADARSEFQRLMYLGLATKQSKVLTAGLSWDVDEFSLSWDGKRIAFLTNEDGLSTLHLVDTATSKELPVPKLPVGVRGGLIPQQS